MSLAHHFITGDCRQVLPTMPANLVHSIITDPPYALRFMGRGGDCTSVAFQPETWRQALRVTKPGGYLLACGGTRTFHRLACAIEDAGWQVKDTILSLYDAEPMAQAFLDSLSAEQRELLDKAFPADNLLAWIQAQGFPKGKGTLKPAWESIFLACKPGPKVLPLGIDETRVPTNAGDYDHPGNDGISPEGRHKYNGGWKHANQMPRHPSGRYPANVVLDDSEQVAEAFAAFGDRSCRDGTKNNRNGQTSSDGSFQGWSCGPGPHTVYGDTGSAARFFFTSKASRRERGQDNRHITVKPLALMCWLIRLVTKPGGLVLDPFSGSGTTLLACALEGRSAIGIELYPTNNVIAKKRLANLDTTKGES